MKNNKILMQKGVALWLIEKTKLSNKQIAEFCSIHAMEIMHMRNSYAMNIVPCNPIDACLLSAENIQECEKNPELSLKLQNLSSEIKKTRNYSKKKEIDSAVLWLIKQYPNYENSFITSLLQCTSSLVKSIRDETYQDYTSLTPKNPVTLGLCSQIELDKAVLKFDKNK